jgi:ferrous iron transport protein A
MSLIQMPTGVRARLVSFRDGGGFQARLAAMGLVPGAELHVCSNRGHGPLVIEVKGSRMILGRGLAGKILVA